LRVCGLGVGLAPQLLERYQSLTPFADVPEALQQLKDHGAKLAILSNADPDMLNDLVAGARLDTVFDHLISVRVAGTFKPAPRVYALATQTFDCKPGDIIFVSANRWDVAGAKSFGFRTVWVNRSRAPDEYADWAADRVVPDLSELNSATAK
jgi:2-haloacid dehalogenase